MSNNILMMDNRQLVPRWHTSRKLFKFKYPSQTGKNERGQLNEDYWFKKSVENWLENSNISNTVDVFVRLIQDDQRNHPLYNEIHRQLLDQYDDLSASVKNLICPQLKLLDKLEGYSTDVHGVRMIIGKLKNIVNTNPRDSLTWMDLGFYYSIIGELSKALHCVEVAKNLDPNHPFIARCYSRFLVHIGDSEQAVWYLKKRPNLKSNPLIMSAYTAISSAFDLGKPNIKDAIYLINNWNGDKAKISELAACIGTIEFKNGSLQKGKKHMQLALAAPSENVIAHVQWLHNKHHLNFKNMPQSNASIEGGVNDLYAKRMFVECRDKLLEMHKFQPYSVGPIVDAGYLSIAGLDDPQFVIDISENRISKSHMGFGELNNLIVAKLQKKQTQDIDVDLRLLSRRVNLGDPNSSAIFRATSGMAFIENGLIDEGVKLYDDAISILEKNGLNRSLCLAKHFYSKQMVDISPQRSEELKKESLRLAKKFGVLEIIKE